MKEILERITSKKALLDSLRPLPVELEKNLYEWFRVALTYSSNAIEGNTLTLAQTAQIVEKQITVSGKTIIEHLEAINHAQAVSFIKNLATTKTRYQLTVDDILAIHQIILQKINDEWAGKFRETAVRITGSQVPRPNYVKVPELMQEFISEVKTTDEHTVKVAINAHLKFVFIHPFVDGNGRTARLLLNLILQQDNYPLVFLKVEDRQAYIDAIEKALQKGMYDDYYMVMLQAIEHSLDEYLLAAQESNLQLK